MAATPPAAFPPPPALFAPLAPGHSVATLVLIENSDHMHPRWPDLRDRYLPNLLGTMRRANPLVPIQVLWMLSCPAPADDPAPPHSSRQYNQLPELRFNSHPHNRISLGTLYRAVELLGSTFQDKPTTRHLFVVAASRPTDELDGIHPGAAAPDPWQALASVLYEKSIYLHMILTASPQYDDMGKFTRLFYDTGRFQGCSGTDLWFPADHEKYMFFLSQSNIAAAAAAAQQAPNESYNTVAPPLYPPPTSTSTTPPQRSTLPRNNSFPPPTLISPSTSSRSTFRPALHLRHDPTRPELQRPSLVKHLQKVHGLTKKRTYGVNPPRSSFIREHDQTAEHALDSIGSNPPQQLSQQQRSLPIINTTVDANGVLGLSPNGSGAGSPVSTAPRASATAAAAGIPRRPRRSSASQIAKQKATLPLRAPSLSPDSEPSRSGSSSGQGTGVGSPLKPAPSSYGARDPEVVYPSAPLAMDTTYQSVPSTSPASSSSSISHQQYMDQQQYPAPPGPPPVPPIPMPQQVQMQAPQSIPLPHTLAQSQPQPLTRSPQTPITPTAASHLPLDDGERPFIWYPEYEQAPLMQKQPSLGYSADVGMMGAAPGTDYSGLLNPAVAQGVLQAHSGQASVQGYAYPEYAAYGGYEGAHGLQVSEVEGWGGY